MKKVGKINSVSIYATWPLFASVLVLILNDHFFKYLFPSFLTGKLSDVSGIFLATLVLRGLFTNRTVFVSIVLAVLFSWWKSSYSQAFIDFVNLHSPLLIGRTIDYSDLFVLLVMPFAHSVYENREQYLIKLKLVRLLKMSIIVATALAMMGTIIVPHHHHYIIRKELITQQIDMARAIEIMKKELANYDIECESCYANQSEGLFVSKEITVRYLVLENSRGIEFDITGIPARFYGDSLNDMNAIKSNLQKAFKNEFEGMEFVIRLEK